MLTREIFLPLFLFFFCLYKTSQSFRYVVKFTFYVLYVSVASVLLIPIFVLNPCDVNNLILASTVCRPVSSILGLQWKLKGKRYLMDKKPCVIVSNHQSIIDVLGMFDIWHIMGKCTVIAKRQILYVLPFGLAAWLAGLTFINRLVPDQAKNEINAAAIRIKRMKMKLWVFPEGTRSDTGKIHNFKKGAFYTAIHAQLPILPVVFSHYYFLNFRKKLFEPGNVIITVLPPISTDGLTTEDVEKLMNQTKAQMDKVFIESSREVKESADVCIRDKK